MLGWLDHEWPIITIKSVTAYPEGKEVRVRREERFGRRKEGRETKYDKLTMTSIPHTLHILFRPKGRERAQSAERGDTREKRKEKREKKRLLRYSRNLDEYVRSSRVECALGRKGSELVDEDANVGGTIGLVIGNRK